MIDLPTHGAAEMRLILMDSPTAVDIKSEWRKVLSVSTPLFLHESPSSIGTLVRWWMSKEDAQRMCLWGLQCCGNGNDLGSVWEFDTPLQQVSWYWE